MKPAHSSDVLSAQPVEKTGNRRPKEAFAHPRGRLRRILHVTALAGYGARGSPKLALAVSGHAFTGSGKTRLRSLRVGADATSAQPSEARLQSVAHQLCRIGRKTDRNDDCLPIWEPAGFEASCRRPCARPPRRASGPT